MAGTIAEGNAFGVANRNTGRDVHTQGQEFTDGVDHRIPAGAIWIGFENLTGTDAILNPAVIATVDGCPLNAGQTCTFLESPRGNTYPEIIFNANSGWLQVRIAR